MALNFTFLCNPQNYKCDNLNSPPIHVFTLDNIVGVTFTVLDIKGHTPQKLQTLGHVKRLKTWWRKLSVIVVSSNCQFDSRLKVRNRLDLSVCRCSATHRWKALNERYKFSLDLIPIRGQSTKLWTHKVPEVQTETILGPRTKSHSDVGAME